MFRLKKVRPFPLPQFSLLCLLALCVCVAAQDKDDDKDKDKESGAKSGASAKYVKVEGKVRCDKPDPVHSIEVPDRPGHSLSIAKRKCTWTEPLVILGTKTKEGIAVGFTEEMEGALHVHGFETDTMDNGEKITMQSMGQVLGEKGPAVSKGRWSLMRGTGKLRGIKGGGTYEGKLEADDVLVLEFEGVYDPTELVSRKK